MNHFCSTFMKASDTTYLAKLVHENTKVSLAQNWQIAVGFAVSVAWFATVRVPVVFVRVPVVVVVYCGGSFAVSVAWFATVRVPVVSSSSLSLFLEKRGGGGKKKDCCTFKADQRVYTCSCTGRPFTPRWHQRALRS